MGFSLSISSVFGSKLGFKTIPEEIQVEKEQYLEMCPKKVDLELQIMKVLSYKTIEKTCHGFVRTGGWIFSAVSCND